MHEKETKVLRRPFSVKLTRHVVYIVSFGGAIVHCLAQMRVGIGKQQTDCTRGLQKISC